MFSIETGQSQSLAHAQVLTCIVLTVIVFLIVTILKILVAILDPMYYYLDMTTKTHCKPLAEIDNNIRYRRGIQGEFHSNTNHDQSDERQASAIDCDASIPTGGGVGPAARTIKRDYNSNYETNISDGAMNELEVLETSSLGSVNHVYPNGWIPIMESCKLPPGSIKSCIIFGRDVVVTRSIEGNTVNVLDAYCPHSGVHIGMGGRVRQVDDQSCVECPFHGWLFRASDGQCIRIPYSKENNSKKIPNKAKLSSWHCVELDNFIYVWYHVDGELPTWHLEPCEELTHSDWQLAGRSCHKTNLDLRDMHENGADMNHFEGIHNDLFVFGGDLLKLRPLNYLQKYVRHHWLPKWEPILSDTGRPTHMARMQLQSHITLFNFRIFDITVNAIQVGPARVNLYYDSPWYGKGLLTMNAIPVGGRRTKYIQHIYTKSSLFQCFMAKWVLWGEIKMLERDFSIWNHKKCLRTPVLVPEDRTLKNFRRWYSQFYKRKLKVTIVDCADNERVQSNDKTTNPGCKWKSLEF